MKGGVTLKCLYRKNIISNATPLPGPNRVNVFDVQFLIDFFSVGLHFERYPIILDGKIILNSVESETSSRGKNNGALPKNKNSARKRGYS